MMLFLNFLEDYKNLISLIGIIIAIVVFIYQVKINATENKRRSEDDAVKFIMYMINRKEIQEKDNTFIFDDITKITYIKITNNCEYRLLSNIVKKQVDNKIKNIISPFCKMVDKFVDIYNSTVNDIDKIQNVYGSSEILFKLLANKKVNKEKIRSCKLYKEMSEEEQKDMKMQILQLLHE